MLNQIVLVGRLVEDLQVEEIEERKVVKIKLAIPRSWKNEEGIYETDFVPITLWDNVAKNTAEYCKKGDIIGVKGRIQGEEGTIQIIAEKVTFLSSKSSNDKEEVDE